jgi:hypothetical protein
VRATPPRPLPQRCGKTRKRASVSPSLPDPDLFDTDPSTASASDPSSVVSSTPPTPTGLVTVPGLASSTPTVAPTTLPTPNPSLLATPANFPPPNPLLSPTLAASFPASGSLAGVGVGVAGSPGGSGSGAPAGAGGRLEALRVAAQVPARTVCVRGCVWYVFHLPPRACSVCSRQVWETRVTGQAIRLLMFDSSSCVVLLLSRSLLAVQARSEREAGARQQVLKLNPPRLRREKREERREKREERREKREERREKRAPIPAARRHSLFPFRLCLRARIHTACAASRRLACSLACRLAAGPAGRGAAAAAERLPLFVRRGGRRARTRARPQRRTRRAERRRAERRRADCRQGSAQPGGRSLRGVGKHGPARLCLRPCACARTRCGE